MAADAQHLLGASAARELPELGRWNYLLLAILVAVEGPIATLLEPQRLRAVDAHWAVFLSRQRR